MKPTASNPHSDYLNRQRGYSLGSATGGASTPNAMTAAASINAADQPTLGAQAQQAQTSIPDSTPSRSTTANWFTHFNRECPPATPQQEPVAAARGRKRTSSDADLTLARQPTQMQHSDQDTSSCESSLDLRPSPSVTSDDMDIDEIAISPMTQSLSVDEDASTDVDAMDWDLNSEDERILRSTIAHGDTNPGDGRTEATSLASHQGGLMAQEPDAASVELSCGHG